MAGRLYRMAKVVSANPASWGIVDANQISGFRTVAKLTDLYSIAACILSSSYGDGTTTGADAVGQIWHVQESNEDYKLINWANRGKAAGWEKVPTANEIFTAFGDEITPILEELNQKDETFENNLNSVTSDLNSFKTDSDAKFESLNLWSGAVADKLNTFGLPNGFATLDTKGFVPLSQLGNLDTTLFEVVTELPSTIATIKKHIYLKAAGTTGNKNNYAEYIYTGDLTATYDATKWEKLGEVTASVGLSGYYTKDEIDTKISTIESAALLSADITKSIDSSDIYIDTFTIDTSEQTLTTIPIVTTTDTEYVGGHNGLMSPTMLTKLNSALTEAPSFELATSGNESLLNIEVTYNKKPYTVSLPNAGEGGVGLMTSDMYTKLEDTSNNLSTLTTKVNDLTTNVNGIKSFSVNNVVDGEQYSLMATDGTDAFNVGNIFIRTAGNGNTEIEAGGKKTDINAIAAYARYDINGNHIDATYLKKADLVAISNDELTEILI